MDTSTMAEHVGYISTSPNHSRRAFCRCGWQGPYRDKAIPFAVVDEDRREHLARIEAAGPGHDGAAEGQG